MKQNIIRARVYRQDTPKPNGRTFRVEGSEYPDHNAQFVLVGEVSGNYEGCWVLARQLTRNPVLEFPRSTYRRINWSE